MATGPGKTSPQNVGKGLTHLERAKNWVREHPSTTKILKIATITLGIGLLASIPFAIPLGNRVVASLGFAGTIAIITSLFLFACSGPAVSGANVPQPGANQSQPAAVNTSPENPVDESGLTVTDKLWSKLKQKSEDLFKQNELLPYDAFHHRFTDILCPVNTAIKVEGRDLHASRVGEGITTHSFVASQAPTEVDFKRFWKAILDGNYTIFDLLGNKYNDNDLKPYFPSKLNEPIQFSTVSVELIEDKNPIHTYRVIDSTSSSTKTISRYSYCSWPDYGIISVEELQDLVGQVETLTLNSQKPTWVHCKAGVGRTGTLITAAIIKQKIAAGELNKENLGASLVDIILHLRKQRGTGFVQSKNQFNLLYQYAESLIPT